MVGVKELMLWFCGLFLGGIWFLEGRGGVAFPRGLFSQREKVELPHRSADSLFFFAAEKHVVHLQSIE